MNLHLFAMSTETTSPQIAMIPAITTGMTDFMIRSGLMTLMAAIPVPLFAVPQAAPRATIGAQTEGRKVIQHDESERTNQLVAIKTKSQGLFHDNLHAVHTSTHITYTNTDLAYSFAKTILKWYILTNTQLYLQLKMMAADAPITAKNAAQGGVSESSAILEPSVNFTRRRTRTRKAERSQWNKSPDRVTLAYQELVM